MTSTGTAAIISKFAVSRMFLKVAVALLMFGALVSPSPAKAADGPYAYGGNFALNGSFYLSYDYEFEGGVPVRRMRVFEAGKLGLINAPIETATWSTTSAEATFTGRFTARGITYTLKANYILVKGIRAAQFFV